MSTQPLLSVENASFGYDIPGGQTLVIAESISFSVNIGSFLLLTGPNGCGKSTVIRGLLGLAARCGGSVTWNIPRSALGYIPQETAIDSDIPATALDIVKTARPGSWTQSTAEAREALDRVDMADKSHCRFGTLSGGQKRRILIARALFGKPQLLILDEPTVNTDRVTELKIESILLQLVSDKSIGVLATTHVEGWGAAAQKIAIGGRS